jgi:two-component system, cell cycle sensor histidine kinase and response regulator CckA
VGGVPPPTAFLLERETDSAKRASDLALIREMSDRAAALTRSLLSFTGRPAAKREPVDLGAVVTNLAPIFERAVDARIKVTVEGRSTRTVLGDAAELEQVVMNLVMNARDAMADGGALTIDVRDEDDTTVLVVGDTGPGIAVELRERVFEPYFTTKSAHAFPGAGLGLATVYGVVHGHGGTIAVDDAAGGGARITVRLPSVAGALASRDAPSRNNSGAFAPGTRPRVLLAEDDDVVRFVSQRALESVGYDVVTARDGDEAIAILEARGAELAALLLDVHMPGCGGVGAFRRARALFPALPVLFITGYSDDDEQRQIVEMGADACLQKPVAIELLDEELRRLITTRREA